MRGCIFWIFLFTLFSSAVERPQTSFDCMDVFSFPDGKVFSYQKMNKNGKPSGRTVYVVKKHLSNEAGSTVILGYQNYNAKGEGEGWGECYMICDAKCFKMSAKPLLTSRTFQKDKSGSRNRKGEYLIYPKSIGLNMNLPPASLRVFMHAMSDDIFTFVRLDITGRKVVRQSEINFGGGAVPCFVIEGKCLKESFTEGSVHVYVTTTLREYYSPEWGVLQREQLSADGTVMNTETFAINQ